MWELYNCNCICPLSGHNRIVRCLVKLNEFQLVSGSDDKSIKIWDLPDGFNSKTKTEHDGAFWSSSFIGSYVYDALF